MEEKLNESKARIKSQVVEKKVIVLITGDIFLAVVQRICCDALDRTQVSSHAILFRTILSWKTLTTDLLSTDNNISHRKRIPETQWNGDYSEILQIHRLFASQKSVPKVPLFRSVQEFVGH